MMELKLYSALLVCCLRRKDVPAGSEPWGYAQLASPVLWLWVFGSATETVAFHFILLPWDRVRLVVDIISLWGLVWMLGLIAAYHIRPHLLSDHELRIRNGVYHDIEVPRRAVAAAAAKEADLPSAMVAFHREPHEDGDHLSVGVSGRTNLTLRLHQPTTIETAKGVFSATTVSLWADDPRALAARLNQTRRVTGRTEEPGSADGARRHRRPLRGAWAT
ncbi:MAG TPA: hypothetical protein VFD59_20020 [Nocardioidaceae bacterium]|nr:hypothetical protein [Nocardioidaceae bacterium]